MHFLVGVPQKKMLKQIRTQVVHLEGDPRECREGVNKWEIGRKEAN